MALSRDKVLSYYNQFPFERHPLWQAIIAGTLTHEQVMLAETQHFVRSNIGREFRKKAAEESKSFSEKAHELLMETYREECTEDDSGPSHVDLIKRFLLMGGVAEDKIISAKPTVANSAAIALYKDIGERGPLHHMLGAGAVEYFYSFLSPKILEAYVTKYRLTEDQAETYKIHGPMDREHAERALSILEEPYIRANAESIEIAVRDAFAATSLHYDGMLEAATGRISYWDGK